MTRNNGSEGLRQLRQEWREQKFTGVYEYYIALRCPECRVILGEVSKRPGEDEKRLLKRKHIYEESAHRFDCPGFVWPARAEIDALARRLSRKKINLTRRFAGRQGSLNVRVIPEHVFPDGSIGVKAPGEIPEP